ncbi:DUF3194 domain-containing protein [Thermococcus sp.]|uniref:DUF3194 domain-containing protein n=1 Tax=Thermococcus sp. TaxID=35749 RepID=UPI00260492C3|nr:DUF3194 domain-containing protein [Thermococcus sp.]
MGAEKSSERKVVYIGLPDLEPERLVEIGEIAQETIIDRVFEDLTKSEVKDFEVTTRINRGKTLDLEIEVYLEVPIFVRTDVGNLIDEAIDMAYRAVEQRLWEIAHEGEGKA